VPYRKPLLVEVYSELQLEPQLAAPAIFEIARGLADVVPNTELGHVSAIGGFPALLPALKCWDGAHKRLVQLCASTVVVNQVGEYLGWTVFEQLFQRVHAQLARVAPSGAILSISLHALDQLRVPEEEFRLGAYLKCGGRFLPQYYAEVSEPCDYHLGRGALATDNFNRQVHVTLRHEDKSMIVQMETVFQDRLRPDRSVASLLDQLHREATDTFEELITDETRRLMGAP
jgi:uncharacterized protein (TIGR04255 family)